MRERNHDRLEEFFRKAASGADVPFNEADWKKLEARLDAEAPASPPATAKMGAKRIASLAVVGAVLVVTSVWWAGSRFTTNGEEQGEVTVETNEVPSQTGDEQGTGPTTDAASKESPQRTGIRDVDAAEGSTRDGSNTVAQAPRNESQEVDDLSALREKGKIRPVSSTTAGTMAGPVREGADEAAAATLANGPAITTALSDDKIFRELIFISPANADKIKQKADVDLPGAEEGDTGEADAVVTEEDASVKRMATPRLSLLLSFAPDFSSTSNQYSAPGKAFGAILHYHVMQRWSLSAGVIRNNKRYRGAGEDYQPPKGYWKYYTNGIIPNSIDGSCTVLEFPLMIQYAIAQAGKNRWLVAAGTSSYLMLDESYRYYFEEPNPGAKDGWASKSRSRFYFNMVNVSVGFERQVLPSLMLGIEPYAKIPLEAIGWSNIRLFSTGVSLTLRYKLVGRRNIFPSARSRPPD